MCFVKLYSQKRNLPMLEYISLLNVTFVYLNPLSQISSVKFSWLRGFRRRFTQVTIPETKSALPFHYKKRWSKALLSNIKEVPEVEEDVIAERYGYDGWVNFEIKFGYIKPVPSKILTVFQPSRPKKFFYISKMADFWQSYDFVLEGRSRELPKITWF